MRGLATTVAVLSACFSFVTASSCTQSNGNWYCNQVESVSYLNFGGSGSYNAVSYMNDATGECDFKSTSYSGSIAPFDEELSIHIRGPFYLKQFAFYTPSTAASKAKRQTTGDTSAQHEDALEERAVTLSSCPGSNQTSYTSNGKTFIVECGFDRPGNIGMTYESTFQTCVDKCALNANCVDVSYVSNSGGACYQKSSILAPNYQTGVWGARLVSSAAGSTSSQQSVKSTMQTSVKTSSSSTTTSTTSKTTTKSSTSTSTTASASTTKSTISTTSSTTSIKTSSSSKSYSSSASSSPAATGNSWSRQSYYSSTAGTAQGVTFLNTNGGGSVSGIWSSKFGGSLSYSSTDGSKAASSPQILNDAVLAASSEIALFAGTSCASDNGCGYYRPGTVAYHGFAGALKIFLFEFSMPAGSGNNQPAMWFLNALIPRTQQYGSCNCWENTNGCGEFDIFETLSPGETRMTSSIHGNQAGGDSDYFPRPMSGTVKAAVVLSNHQAHIKFLDSSFVFGSTLSAANYADLMSTAALVAGGNSTVTLS